MLVIELDHFTEHIHIHSFAFSPSVAQARTVAPIVPQRQLSYDFTKDDTLVLAASDQHSRRRLMSALDAGWHAEGEPIRGPLPPPEPNRVCNI